MHRLTLKNDNEDPGYCVGKDENPQSPGKKVEALARPEYSAIEEKNRELYCSNSNQVDNADRENQLEKDCEKAVVLN